METGKERPDSYMVQESENISVYVREGRQITRRCSCAVLKQKQTCMSVCHGGVRILDGASVLSVCMYTQCSTHTHSAKA